MTDKSHMLNQHVKSFLKYGDDIPYCLFIANKEKYAKWIAMITNFVQENMFALFAIKTKIAMVVLSDIPQQKGKGYAMQKMKKCFAKIVKKTDGMKFWNSIKKKVLKFEL